MSRAEQKDCKVCPSNQKLWHLLRYNAKVTLVSYYVLAVLFVSRLPCKLFVKCDLVGDSNIAELLGFS